MKDRAERDHEDVGRASDQIAGLTLIKEKGREGKGREGKGRQGKGREGKGRSISWEELPTAVQL